MGWLYSFEPLGGDSDPAERTAHALEYIANGLFLLWEGSKEVETSSPVRCPSGRDGS
jgi:hypothetical protein